MIELLKEDKEELRNEIRIVLDARQHMADQVDKFKKSKLEMAEKTYSLIDLVKATLYEIKTAGSTFDSMISSLGERELVLKPIYSRIIPKALNIDTFQERAIKDIIKDLCKAALNGRNRLVRRNSIGEATYHEGSFAKPRKTPTINDITDSIIPDLSLSPPMSKKLVQKATNDNDNIKVSETSSQNSESQDMVVETDEVPDLIDSKKGIFTPNPKRMSTLNEDAKKNRVMFKAQKSYSDADNSPKPSKFAKKLLEAKEKRRFSVLNKELLESFVLEAKDNMVDDIELQSRHKTLAGIKEQDDFAPIILDRTKQSLTGVQVKADSLNKELDAFISVYFDLTEQLP